MPDKPERLNEKQQEAVEHLDKPLFVFAGPGTGKTKVATNKLAYLIKEKGVKPNEILALTFSNKAAQEMETRLRELLPGIPNLRISTIHSFCNELLNENALEYGINADNPVFTDEYQQAFFLEHLDDLELEAFEVPTRPIELAQVFQKTITRFKQENITVERLEEYLKSQDKGGAKVKEKATAPTKKKGKAKTEDEDDEEAERLAQLRDIAKAYRAYEEFKATKGLLDFGDMQLRALQLLEDRPLIYKRYQKLFKYLIVDEFQDTDFIQLRLLFKLASQGNVTVVGDDDQSIYRFRGAYLTNMREFDEFYTKLGMKPYRTVLDVNYRCTKSIQRVATNLIGNNHDREDKEITTKKGEGAPVIVTFYKTDTDQAVGIIRRIQELHEKGVPWDEMAVLVRRRVDANPIVEMFERTGVPFEMLGSRELFREPVIRIVVAYLRVLEDPERNQPSLGLLLMRPRHGILPGEVQKLGRYAKDRQTSLWDALRAIESFEGDKAPFLEFRKGLDHLFEIKGESGLLELVRAILFGKDLFRAEVAKNGRHNIRCLNRFLEMTMEFLQIYPEATLEGFLTHIEALTDLGIEEEMDGPTSGRVHLLTIHGSKGMEFPYVFIPCLNKDKIPSRYKAYKIDVPAELADGIPPKGTPEELHLQEERRLLYVGITRGKDQVYLSYCQRYTERKTDSQPSMFLDEILKDTKGIKVESAEESQEELEEVSMDKEEALHRHIHINLERGEWQKALDAITVLAKDKGAKIPALKIRPELDVDEYMKGLKILEQVPEEEHLKDAQYSPSKLRAYDECPKKYWFQHVLGIPGEMKTFFELGSLVHEVIEKISVQIKEGSKVNEKEALAILDSLWVPSVYDSKEKEKQDRVEAEEMVRKFLVHQAIKKGKILDIETWVDFELEGRRIHGRVDRVDDLGDVLEVIDYKTSKSKTSRPQLKEDFQMGVYKLGIEAAYGKKVVRVGHWYLRMDEEWMVELTDTETAAIKERALTIIKSIEEKKYDTTPGYDACRYCDYQELCDED